MTVDRWLSIIGIVEGVGGILLTLAVGLFPRSFSREGQGGPTRSIGQQTTATAGGDVHVVNQATSTSHTSTINTVHNTTVYKTGNPNGNDEDGIGPLLGIAAVGFVIFVVTAIAAVAFVSIEFTVARVAAVVAVVAGVGGLIGVLRSARKRQLSAAATFVLVVMFAAIAATAYLPRWLATPVGDQHRFDDLQTHLARTGNLTARMHDAMKAYGGDLVVHVLLQAFGIGVLVIVVIACATALVFGSSGARWAHSTLSAAMFALLTALGVFAATGGLAATVGRLSAKDSYTASVDPSQGDASAPPLALGSDQAGNLTLTLARCGAERVVGVSVDGGEVLRRPADPTTPTLVSFQIRRTTSQAPLRVALVTTRRYEASIEFPALTPGQTSYTRPGTTAATFAQRGYAC